MVSISSSDAIEKSSYSYTQIYCTLKERKKKKTVNKESAREKRSSRGREIATRVQLILSVEQSIKNFHANAVIHSTPARTLRPVNQISNKNTELYTAFKMHANVTWWCVYELYVPVCTVQTANIFQMEALLTSKTTVQNWTVYVMYILLISCGDGAVTFYTS